MAKIQLNGKYINLKKNISISQLLKKYKLNERKIAIELNKEIISKQKYNKTILKDKDNVEIVYFIGGG
jgi:thiamine biosynthesis protein ThiS|tara:strand:+ start:108 stop:311 length:204 start_codon:yes stop_codon:yes gene_type:complete